MAVDLSSVLAAIAANPMLGVIVVLCIGATMVNGATDAPCPAPPSIFLSNSQNSSK